MEKANATIRLWKTIVDDSRVTFVRALIINMVHVQCIFESIWTTARLQYPVQNGTAIVKWQNG